MFGVASTPALAATVSLDEVQFCNELGGCKYMSYETGTVLSYAGEDEEANRVVVRRDGSGVAVADAGAVLKAGSHCIAVASGPVRCDHGAVPMVGYRLQGGTGDDVIAILGSMHLTASVGEPQLLFGGAGNDVLTGGDGADRIAGGPGSDELHGGGGDDVLFDARFDFPAISRADVDGAEPDVADGGAGNDTVDYTRRTRPLTLTLSGPLAGGGEQGEADRVSNVENVEGGAGNDVITGDDRPNRLNGGNGDDRLAGASANDELIGGRGGDTLLGGTGDDRLGLGDATIHSAQGPDHAICGPGHDVAGVYNVDDISNNSWTAPDPNDIVQDDCEDVPFGDAAGDITGIPGAPPRPLHRGRHVWVFANPCRHAYLGRCTGRLELARPGARTPFAHATFTQRGDIHVHLGRSAARRLAHANRVAIRIRAKQLKRFGAQASVAFVLVFRR